jgi:hypothetical protein
MRKVDVTYNPDARLWPWRVRYLFGKWHSLHGIIEKARFFIFQVTMNMSTIFSGHYDGRVIVPDQPLSLPVGQPLEIRVETRKVEGQFADLAAFAADLPDSPGDLSAQHNHYLYGTPKR